MSITEQQISVDKGCSDEKYSHNELRKILRMINEESAAEYLLDLLIARVENICLEGRGISAYRAKTEKLLYYIRVCIDEGKYHRKKVVSTKLQKITDILQSKINTYNIYSSGNNLVLNSLIEECNICKSLLQISCQRIDEEQTENIQLDNIVYFPNLSLNDDLTVILSSAQNLQDSVVDLTDYYTFSIDSDGTHVFDDALSIDRLNDGRILLCIHVTNIGEKIKIDSQEDKLALTKNIKGREMFTKNIINLHSLSLGAIRNVMTCMLVLDKDGQIIDENDIYFFKSKIRVDKQLHFSDIYNILNGSDSRDVDLREKMELLNNISLLIYNKRSDNYSIWPNSHDHNVPFKNSSIDKKKVAARIVGELMILLGTLAASYAEQKKYPFLRSVDFSYIQHNLDLFPDISRLNLFQNGYTLKGNLMRAKYFLSAVDGQLNKDIGRISQMRVSSPLWRYIDLANQRVINEIFLNPYPDDKELYLIEDNLKKTADAFNSRIIEEVRRSIVLEERKRQKLLKIEESRKR